MRRRFGLAATVALIALVLLRIADPFPVVALREAYFDTLQRINPRTASDLPVRVVDIDEASLAVLGQWPWPRDRLAELTDRLAELGAAAVVFDVLFAEPDRLSPAALADLPSVAAVLRDDDRLTLRTLDTDEAFGRALAEVPTVVGIAASATQAEILPPIAGFVSVGPDPLARLSKLAAHTPIVPTLARSAAGIGSINVSADGLDGTVRQVPLVWNGPAGPVPGLAVEGLRVALGESTFVLVGIEDGPGLESVRIGEFEAPTSDEGMFRVRYRPFDPEMFVSAVDVLSPSPAIDLSQRIEGHIVLVGTSAAGLLDIRATPLGESVPGVSIHAQIIEQILTGDFLKRSDLVSGAEIAALLATGILVSAVMAFLGPVPSILAGGAAAVAMLVAGWFAFTRAGVLFDATFPLMGGFAAFSALAMFQYVVTDRERRMIRRSFSRYVSDDVLSEIEASGHSLGLGGEIRDLTVLFSDIRGFTSLSERTPAKSLVTLLNDLFTVLTDRIQASRGTVDKYIGDSVMAFWNAPLATNDHARLACTAALEMRVAAAEFNRRRREMGEEAIDVRIGLATGPACVGNIGSATRFNYSAIGETVNRASRIEASCRHVSYDILISDEVAQEVRDFAVLPAGALALKGVSDRTGAAILLGDTAMAASGRFAKLAKAHGRLIHRIATSSDHGHALAEARELAASFDRQLLEFYDRIPERLFDFRKPDT